MGKPLVIVESPTKARTIEKFLGSKYEVLASYGHVRDLPNSASEIPAQYKGTKWAEFGVNVDESFEPLYIIPDEKKKRVNELKAALKNASELFLATDEDREGESISWHLLEVLKPKIPVKRLVFHEITKDAIQASLAAAREVDENLVRAQETRRIVDRLFGYSISPVLWRKMKRGLSAGRVQSVAMRLLVERERERIAFRSAIFWDLKALFAKAGEKAEEAKFEAELTHVDGLRVASGRDFEATTGKLDGKSNVIHLDQEKATKLSQDLKSKQAKVTSVEEKPFSQKPAPPFTTSTLQQEASRKLSFAARHTMSVAQRLYENGLITYMRTDSTTLSAEALAGSRSLIEREFGAQYLDAEARIYKTKVKNAQEAHEAIRPAGTDFVHPEEVKQKFGVDAFKLYDMIWKRTIASQMKDAHGTRVTAQIELGSAQFRASGKTIEFPGFLRAYVEGADDPEAELADREKILPKLVVQDRLDTLQLDSLSHETQAPARFTEGSLIKELERLGIGRPSTWASIVDVILQRSYAFKKGTALVPSFLASAVTSLMERYFTKLLDYGFTASMEDDLDAISRGEINNVKYLKKFYFGNGTPGLADLVKEGVANIDPREINGIPIGKDTAGNVIEVRIGRYGPFITNGTDRAGVPDTLAPDELTIEGAMRLLTEAAKGPEPLGLDPVSSLPVFLKAGRFGPYIQLGIMEADKEKPKMCSLLPGMTPSEVTLESALKLLEFPKSLGIYPENSQEIIASNGRYGPYIKCGTDTRSIPQEEFSLLTLTLEQACDLLKRPKTRGGRTAAQPKVIKELGKHPVSQATISLRSGRYGPYVTDGTTNASLQRGTEPETLTLDQAISLIEAREAAGPSKKAKRGAKKKTPKAEATSKEATKKEIKPKATKKRSKKNVEES